MKKQGRILSCTQPRFRTGDAEKRLLEAAFMPQSRQTQQPSRGGGSRSLRHLSLMNRIRIPQESRSI